MEKMAQHGWKMKYGAASGGNLDGRDGWGPIMGGHILLLTY